MASPDLSPTQRGRLRQLATLAYDRELSRELGMLERSFHQWRAGQISAGDLAGALHEFHEGPTKRMWVLYRESDLIPAVARAVALRLLENHEVGADLLRAMERQIEFFSASH